MSGLALLIPVALGMGALGLAVFFWAMKSGQFEDLDGAAQRILIDDEADPVADSWPQDVRPYKRTATFTEHTVPKGLLANHSTKEGSWGLIHVEAGRLKYIVSDDRREAHETILSPDTQPGIVEPTILHRVEPMGAVRFHVEFFRRESGFPEIER